MAVRARVDRGLPAGAARPTTRVHTHPGAPSRAMHSRLPPTHTDARTHHHHLFRQVLRVAGGTDYRTAAAVTRPAGGGGAHAHTRAGGASDDTPESPPAPAEGLAGEGSAREARAAGVHHVPPTARPRGRLLSGNTHCQQSQHLPSRPDLLSHSRGCGLRLPLAPPRTYPSPTVFPCFQAPTEARSCSARGRTTWHCAGGRCPGVPRRCRRTTGARCWCRWSRGRRTHTAS
jgi:hypothetical protein